MRASSILSVLIIISSGCEALAAPRPLRERDTERAAASIVSIGSLEQQARRRVGAKSRLPLVAEDSDIFKGIESLESSEAGRLPNYLRALATLPSAVKPFARLINTAIYSGAVPSETKLALGLRVAQVYASPYVGAHMIRMLGATERGRALLSCMRSDDSHTLSPTDRAALAYSVSLSRDVNGVSDEEFQILRAHFNDSQIVELTMTVCFFNYFTRFSEGAGLPVEPWAIDGSPFKARPLAAYEPPAARVALISDAEIGAVIAMDAAAKDPSRQTSGLGLGVANSQRAMMRSPQFALAWRAYGAAVREYAAVSREVKLHISFAVSMANGCRYCTLHQVLGLRRLNVDPAKLMAMKKSDAVLSARELKAVEFARKLTREPTSITDADYEKIRAEFTEQGAVEVLLQTCAFSFMNRFTDGLSLPSEDEAIRVYKEVYGSEWSMR